MVMGFWGKLNLIRDNSINLVATITSERPASNEIRRPIFALAPMADVTDAAFRKIIAKYGKFNRPDGSIGGGPDVIWTEFVSCDGLCSRGRENLLIDLKYSEAERPIVAQFFGSYPKHFYECAQLAQELGFDGIDINMGCPDKNVIKQGAGANLIKTPELAQEIIRETKRGAGKLPVSVKTRAGDAQNSISEWLPYILETEPAVITIHARTRKEMSLAPARWDIISEAVAINQKYNSSRDRTLILGNGDVKSIEMGYERVQETGADGVMIGRAVFGNPWLFRDVETLRNISERSCGIHSENKISLEERLRVMVEHTLLFEEIFKDKTRSFGLIKNFDIMKKHFKAYINGFSASVSAREAGRSVGDGAKKLRVKCMNAKNGEEVKNIIDEFLFKRVL